MKFFLVVLSGLLFAACSGHSSSKGDAQQAPTTTTLSAAQLAANRQALKEVAITSCASNAANHVVIKGTAHNPTTGRVTYTVQLAINDTSGASRYGTAAAANAVAPSSTARWSAVTTARYEPGMRCRVTSVSRTASP
jgi:hypothetical protein